MMNLLTQTINEYVLEHHANWRVHVRDGKTYTMLHCHNSPFIVVRTNKSELALHGINKLDCYNYTELTLLPQIAEIISQIEASISQP